MEKLNLVNLMPAYKSMQQSNTHGFIVVAYDEDKVNA